jgi:hypothetical protein
VVAAQTSGCRDAVEEGHVEIEHDRVRVELLCQLDRLEAVKGGCDNLELGLAVDQLTERSKEGAIVICYQHPDRMGGVRRGSHWRRS